MSNVNLHIASNTAIIDQNANYYDEHEIGKAIDMVLADIQENKTVVLDQNTADCKIDDKRGVTFDEQLINIRVKTLRNYNEILNNVDNLKHDIIAKDIEISDLKKELRSIQAENVEKKDIIPLIQKRFLTESVNTTNFYDDHHHDHHELNGSRQIEELYKGKLLISELISQLDGGFGDIEIENYELTDLISIFSRSVLTKQEQLEVMNRDLIQNIEEENRQLIKEVDDQKGWQKHLENENEKLNFKIENLQRVQMVLMSKENENNDIKENYLKIQCMFDDLREEDAHLKMLVNRYKHQLTKKEMKCVDSDALIKTLELNLTEQTNNYKQAVSMYNSEKEKSHEIHCHLQQMVDEFTTKIHEKQLNINSIQDECTMLKNQVSSTEAEIENLKHNIITLEYVLNEKNKIIQDLLKKNSKLQNTKTSSVHFKDLENLSKLVEQMDTVQNNLCVCKEKVSCYEEVLCSMQNSIDQQLKVKTAEIENKKLTENRKNDILLKHLQKEIECLKLKHNLKVKNLTDTEVRLKNEIQNLEKNVKLKSSQIIVAEKIACSQLNEAFNSIESLRQENQKLELNNRILKESNLAQPTTTIIIDKKVQRQMESLIDLVKKLRLENKLLRKSVK